MEYFSIIKDKDIFENPTSEPEEYKTRTTVKGIVFDNENKIALLSNGEHSLFPGGGVEQGESLEEAFIRECREEIGCNVKILGIIGYSLQYGAKNKTKYDITFFLSKIVGEKGSPTTTEKGELACVLSWLSTKEVINILRNQLKSIRKDDYQAHFNCRTHLLAFEKYLDLAELLNQSN